MLSRALFLLPGLWPGQVTTHGMGAGETPALRRLARWLGRASPGDSPGAGSAHPCGWETALAGALSYGPARGGRQTWLAQPVRLTPGMKDVVAEPVSGIDPQEREALWQAAAPELEAAGAVLQLSAHGLWLLEMESDGLVDGWPPSIGCGRSMQAPPLHSDTARRLRVLENGLQMAWFQHPVNQRREADGRDPVHGLWLWSPGETGGEAASRCVLGGGPVARWLAEQAGARWVPDPGAGPAETNGAEPVVVVDALAQVPSLERRLEILESVAEDVLAPWVAALRRGRVGRLEIRDPQAAGGSVAPVELSLTRTGSIAFWRSARRL